MNKHNIYIALIVSALLALMAAPLLAQQTHNAGIQYGTGTPVYTPSNQGSRLYIDLVTGVRYNWNINTLAWQADAQGIMRTTGGTPPLAAPGYGQPGLALNYASPPELYVYVGPTGTDWLCLNCVEATNVTAGDGIAVTGTPPDITISNTGILDVVAGSDISVSISNGVATISATGGGLDWPLLAPNGDAAAPSYSFENAQTSGMYLSNRGEVVLQGVSDIIKTFNVDEGDAGSLRILSGDSNDPLGGNGGRLTIVSGGAPNGSGGTFELSAGAGVNGGNFSMQGGDATTGNGGGFAARAGDGFEGGLFRLESGNSTGGDGGRFEMVAGDSDDGAGGFFLLQAGNGTFQGGDVAINAGNASGQPGGVSITGGDGETGGGVSLNGGAGATAADVGGVVVSGAGLRPPAHTTTSRNALTQIGAGYIIWNTTATKLQVYTGSTWVDLH